MVSMLLVGLLLVGLGVLFVFTFTAIILFVAFVLVEVFNKIRYYF